MGILFSSRRNNNLLHHHNPSLSQPIYSSPSELSAPPPSASYPPPPLQQAPPPPPPPPANYFCAGNAPYYPPPPPPPHSSYYQYAGGYNAYGYAGPMMGQGSSNYPPYYANHGYDGPFMRTPGFLPQPPQTPAPYVDHQNAKKVKNDINVRKDTIKLEVDETSLDCHLVSFTFDAEVDGSITIFYFAKEGAECSFSPLYPEAYMPVRIPFQKGSGQKFHQSPGTGIDLGFFELDDLSKPSPGEDVFPLVILAEACLPPQPVDNQLGQSPLPTTSSHAQITQAILEKNNGGSFQVRVVKQILWIDRVRYELREIYGIGDPVEAGIDDNDQGKECVICMTEPTDTAVLPCRHMCLCRECANALRHQSNKCPICRQAIEELLEIKVNDGGERSVS
ncbi:hypothetical protein NE237_015840 [Protea cynaroides]|uniref:RING-type E3 ubiquitin transferase n=1 Tax=Protea cynaroides TaxID=273540 RepID=A0A9Q0KEU1_9MAGN|nr:hypothetical protein NE237_015840 [Protea cynaroides]